MSKYKKFRNFDSRKKQLYEYIDEAKLIHGHFFDYSKTKMFENKKINVWCNQHQIEFLTCATTHIKGHKGCPQCKSELLKQKKSMQKK